MLAVSENGDLIHINSDGTWSAIERLSTGSDFRNSSWGDKAGAVEASESSEPSMIGDSFIVYDDYIRSEKFSVYYIFSSGILTRSKYILDVVYSNEDIYLSSFYSLKEMLDKKYGECENSSIDWLTESPLWGDEPSKAISYGELILSHEWSTPKTDVFLCVSGNAGEIKLVVEYSSKEFSFLSKYEEDSKLAAII